MVNFTNIAHLMSGIQTKDTSRLGRLQTTVTGAVDETLQVSPPLGGALTDFANSLKGIRHNLNYTYAQKLLSIVVNELNQKSTVLNILFTFCHESNKTMVSCSRAGGGTIVEFFIGNDIYEDFPRLFCERFIQVVQNIFSEKNIRNSDILTQWVGHKQGECLSGTSICSLQNGVNSLPGLLATTSFSLYSD